MMAFLIDMQRGIYAALTSDITAYSNSRDLTALLAVLPLGIVFGAAHALTPGHSKSVLAAYILGLGLRPLRALVTSFVLSLTHITSAVLLALITNALVTRSLVGAGRAPSIEWTSRTYTRGNRLMACLPRNQGKTPRPRRGHRYWLRSGAHTLSADSFRYDSCIVSRRA